MAALIRPALIIALYALLLPIFGPLLDHHFVEWQHQHAHIYAAGRPAAHTHIYEIAGRHQHPQPADRAGNRAAPAAGLVYLTAYDGAGAAPAYLSLTTEAPRLRFPQDGDDSRRWGWPPAERRPPGAYVAPPRQPPRR